MPDKTAKHPKIIGTFFMVSVDVSVLLCLSVSATIATNMQIIINCKPRHNVELQQCDTDRKRSKQTDCIFYLNLFFL